MTSVAAVACVMYVHMMTSVAAVACVMYVHMMTSVAAVACVMYVHMMTVMLNVLSQIMLHLPYNRKLEEEADYVGLIMVAKVLYLRYSVLKLFLLVINSVILGNLLSKMCGKLSFKG